MESMNGSAMLLYVFVLVAIRWITRTVCSFVEQKSLRALNAIVVPKISINPNEKGLRS